MYIPLKAEGAPYHPEDIYIHCGCLSCEIKFIKQAEVYYNYWLDHGENEDILKEDYWWERVKLAKQLCIFDFGIKCDRRIKS